MKNISLSKMHKMLSVLTILMSGQVVAQNKNGQHLAHDTTGQSINPETENIAGQAQVSAIDKEKRPNLKEQSNLDISWQTLVKDLNEEPIAHDIAGRRVYMNEATPDNIGQDVTLQQLVQNLTGHPQNLAEGLLIQDVKSQPQNQNIKDQQQEQDKTDPVAQSESSHPIKTPEPQYPNVTESKDSFVPPANQNNPLPYLDDVYKDSTLYKNSMPPVQTNEQWNATNWDDDDSDHKEPPEIEQYRKMHEELMNGTTSCEVFLNNTVFDPEQVLDIEWHTVYYWNIRSEDPYNMRFTRPTETMVKRFKEELETEIKPPVNWNDAELFLETNVEYNALYIKTNVSGLYRAIPTASFQFHGVPVMDYALKVVNGSLGIANCKAKQCYALCDMEKMPPVEQIATIANSMGFHSPVNHSFKHVAPPSFGKDQDEMDGSLEDNILGDYDNMNVDPLQLNIF